MNSIIRMGNWSPELCILLNIGDNRLADFNRFLAKGFPSTKRMKQGKQFEVINREGLIYRLKTRFEEEIVQGGSHASLYTLYVKAAQYVRWCDENKTPAFTKPSTEGYMEHLQNRVMLGSLKSATYKKRLSEMVTLFTKYLDLPHHYFDNVVIMDDNDRGSFESYTRDNLNQLLPFLRCLFNQTYQQFIDDPGKHMHAYKCTPTMVFTWQGKKYQLCSGITKMMSAATYLLAYYTYANTSDLFGLKQPDNASITLGETWYTMSAFKRRAFKTIQIEIGEHELEVPKYAMSFFDKLLNASRTINSNKNATLLQTIPYKKAHPLKTTTLQDFLKRWVEKHFTFTDQQGNRLRPVISRFRETGAQLTTYYQGDMVNDIMLNNTPNTRKRSYSNGNRFSNNGMIQDAMSIREEQVRSGINTRQAQNNLGLDFLVIEEEYKINLPNLSRVSNGSSCASPFGEKSKKYTRKAIQHKLASKGEKLACADLLACFGCPNQVIVQSLADIWCLLSFKACIEESLYLHLDTSHYRKNFENIVISIDEKILPNINNHLLRQAEKKLDDGFHPLWSEAESVLELISQRSNEV
ncbi:hypothetical protein F0247_10150 [Vibrio crassostreae]|uniref:hypothetical protein n=1 Tax=Vibrio crassostreae TaxID=246167 RepID=UPI00148CB38E|nr:hypothetical protein [Vibrio crassostreae]NOH75456.1 hypothetical protein [Vibrio crassostreae]